MVDLDVWWGDGSCVGQFFYFLFFIFYLACGLWFVGYVIIGA